MPGAGSFVIGQSAVGSDPFDYTPTIMSQYANSPTLMALIDDFSTWIDPTTDIDNFFDTVFNVLTAVGFGLDIWGRIVGVGRVFPVSDAFYLGFKGSNDLGFEQGIYWSGTPFTSNFALSDASYRQLILAKALANITDGSIRSINVILKNLFVGRGKAYVQDHIDMTMTFKFEFVLSPVDRTIVVNSGVLPIPTGVTANVVSA